MTRCTLAPAALPAILGLAAAADLPLVVVDRDNVEVRGSCRVEVASDVIEDRDGNGVVHVMSEGGEEVIVDFGGALLRGAPESRERDVLTGVGVAVTGAGVTLRNLRLDGFKVGVLATAANGLTLEAIEVQRGYGQRLRSTRAAEHAGDWLWPHRNDQGEWRRSYGAAICVEESSGVTIRGVTVRRSQNGIVLSRVEDGRIYDNDCSFLSGWGLAMWRSSRNIVSRNAFDFCVRGYSHGVYNRGQDSAGILLFEQCCGNVFAENSATHCGDGIFGFAGREALGEAAPPVEGEGGEAATAASWHRERGCNDNLFIGNDLSFAAAHGLEMTFSFRNRIIGNRFVGNAICGIWGGYSQQTVIAGNRFVRNGEGAAGRERGGVDIEHSVANQIAGNAFEENACGVALWWDDDPAIFRLPWAEANATTCSDNLIVGNVFRGDAVAIELRSADGSIVADNSFKDVGVELDLDERSAASLTREAPPGAASPPTPPATVLGKQSPGGARRELAGRERIVMTEWGPYDWSGPMLSLETTTRCEDRWRVLGDTPLRSAVVLGAGPLRTFVDSEAGLVRVFSQKPGWVLPYTLRVTLSDGRRLEGNGVVTDALWTVRSFPWSNDPRQDVEAWRAEAANGVEFTAKGLDLDFGTAGPAAAASKAAPPSDASLPAPAVEDLAALPADRFGTIATTTMRFPKGSWTIRTVSDDGVRVWVDDALVIDNWTWHAPTEDRATVTFDEPREASIRVEHFELDGLATLRLDVQPTEGR